MHYTSERIKSIRGMFYLAPFLFFSFIPSIHANFDDEPSLGSSSGLDYNQRQEKKYELEKLRRRMGELRQNIEQKQQEKKIQRQNF